MKIFITMTTLSELKQLCANTRYSDEAVGIRARLELPKLIELVEVMRDALRFYDGCLLDDDERAQYALSTLERFQRGGE